MSTQDRQHPVGNAAGALAGILFVTLIGGCAAPPALTSSFNGYGDDYADLQNRQMLLNLARLHEREPPVFFQLTQINSQYTFTDTDLLQWAKGVLNGAPGVTTNMPPTHTGTASVTGTITHNPSFQLVPLAGASFATQLLEPIRPEAFFELYEDGWPIDLLMRVLIEKIVIEPTALQSAADQQAKLHPDQPELAAAAEALKKLKTPMVLVNDPWQGIPDPNDPISNRTDGSWPTDGPAGYYDRFLRACALSREYQKAGLLIVYTLPPTDDKSGAAALGGVTLKFDAKTGALDVNATQPGNGSAVSSNSSNGSTISVSTPGEQVSSGQGNYGRLEFKLDGVTEDDGVENPAYKALTDVLRDSDPNAFGLPERPIGRSPIDISLIVLGGGLTVTGSPTGKQQQPVRMVMRSLMSVMTALANEQDGFSHFSQYYNGGIHPYWGALPRIENHPALRLTSEPGDGRAVAHLSYKGRPYVIADPYQLGAPVPSTWNRDVFRLLVQLSYLVTVDPSAYANSFIQLHQ